MKKLIPMAGLAISGLLMLPSCVPAGAYDRGGATYVREDHYYPAAGAPAQATPPPAERQYAQADASGYGSQASASDQGSYGYGSQTSASDQGNYGYGSQQQADYGDQGNTGSQGGYGDQGSYGSQGGSYDQGAPAPAPAPAPADTGAAYADGYREGYQDSRQAASADAQYYDTRYYDRRSNNIDVNYFYGRLAPYGDWVPSRRYGYVWCPSRVSAGWRPYVVGHWAWTDDYGWMWVSDEAWGWATYHYGRWYYDDDYGWAWVPGYTWAPAWVAWRHSPTYVGWAPIPPDIDIDVRVGFHFDVGLVSRRIRPTHWCFMQEQYFVEPDCSRYVVSPVGNTVIINNTTVINNYTVVNNKIINRNIDIHEIERRTHRSVPHYRVARADSADFHGRVERDTLRVFAPSVKPEPRGVKAPPREIRDRVNLTAVKERQREHVKVLETDLKRQAQDIKSGRRRADAPAPDLVSISDRDRRGRPVPAGISTRPGSKEMPTPTGRTTRPGAKDTPAGRVQPGQPAASGTRTAPEVKTPDVKTPETRGGKGGEVRTGPATTGTRTPSATRTEPTRPETRGRGTAPGRTETTPRITPNQKRPETGTPKSGVSTEPGQTATRTMPGRTPASDLRSQRLQERESFKRSSGTAVMPAPARSGATSVTPTAPAPSGVVRVMPSQPRSSRGFEAGAPSSRPGLERPETGSPESRGGAGMREGRASNPFGRGSRSYESGPGMMPPSSGSRSYGGRPSEVRTPQTRSEVTAPSFQREVTPPSAVREVPSVRSQSRERQFDPAPSGRSMREAAEPARESREPVVRRESAPESRRSEVKQAAPERVAPRSESRSETSSSRGNGHQRDKKDKDK